VLFAEPPRTQYDLRFSVAGIPVRVHPFFWLVTLLFGASGGTNAVGLLTWIAVVFVSILVHEMGHALVQRYYGWAPSVILYHLGGLATYNSEFTSSFGSYRRAGNTPLAQIAISIAGPAAGFLFAGIVVAALFASGHYVDWYGGIRLGMGDRLPVFHAEGEFNPVFVLVWDLLFVNIFWGLLNLFPVYPLDGGKIAREILTVTSRSDGVRQSLMLSMVTGAGLALFGLVSLGQPYIALLFGFLAYDSYRMLQSYGSGGFGRPW
jgi:stage IV sporulation protein FB